MQPLLIQQHYILPRKGDTPLYSLLHFTTLNQLLTQNFIPYEKDSLRFSLQVP